MLVKALKGHLLLLEVNSVYMDRRLYTSLVTVFAVHCD